MLWDATRELAMVSGLSHITLIVRDLDRMEMVLAAVLGATKVYDSRGDTHSLSRERFFLVGDAVWLAIMEGEPLPARSYNHIAFKIDDAEYEDYRARVKAFGLDMREDRARVPGEGRSLYFYDYDNHLFELHTGTLEERLARYAQRR
jgi:catechol 2,3-dioxygenase-like lactoylglutathione lyase family enzyme